MEAKIIKRFPKTILPTAVIPWDESYYFDEQSFRKQVNLFMNEGIKHLYLFGTAGEGYAITDEQFVDIVKVFAEEMKGPDLFPMVGLLSLSLPTMHKRLQLAYDCGIRDFQFVLPSWGALSDDELIEFFHLLCDPYPDCRFIHYNLMRSKRLVTPEEYRILAEQIPNLVGAKYTTTDILIIHKLMEQSCPLQFFLGELGFAYGSMIGECGLLSSISNIKLAKTWDFFYAAEKRDMATVSRYTEQFVQILLVLMTKMTAEKMDGAYDKVLARLMDPSFPLRLLPPYQTVTERQFEEFRFYLQEYLPEWHSN
jgi:dihydrodipicolinate synthase/N-acetylneuraminate lyase